MEDGNMNRKLHLLKNLSAGIAILILGLPSVYGITYDLEAGSFEKIMPDSVSVEMWGFGFPGNPYTSPGPVLVVPVGDTTLTINLTNNLAVPISLVIPGLPTSLSPVYHPPGGDYEGRVRSLTTETAPGNTVSYSWTNLRPGTFLYHSGTQMQIQIQMGLFGAIKQDFATAQAYPDAATAYMGEVILLYSEVDPVIHNAVRDGEYGPAGTITSTIDYWPAYFLINGEPFQIGQTPVHGWCHQSDHTRPFPERRPADAHSGVPQLFCHIHRRRRQSAALFPSAVRDFPGCG